jgi:iron complex transport system substrate-binding protein
MKRASILMTLALSMAILVAACAPSALVTNQPAATATPAPIVLKDGTGAEFRLEKPAEKIVSLAPSNTEILFAVGAGKQVIAREDFSNYPEEATSLPSIGGSMGKYNLEDMVKLQPDLILASPLTSDEALQSLKTVTPNVFVLPNPTDLEGMYQNLVMVGELTGHKAEAEKLGQDLRARAKAVLDKVATASGKPKVFYELDATEPAKPWTSGPGTFVDLLITLAGGQNIGGSLSGAWAQISQEELIVQNPEVILLGDALYGGITAESVAARPGWKDIQAVKDNRVLPFNDDLVSRPGPRMIDGLEELAKAIHPELIK